jgi:hypothetical protein
MRDSPQAEAWGLLRFLLLWVEPLPASSNRGHVTLTPHSGIFPQRMKLPLVRLIATLLLSGQMLSVGLPLLCDQVQQVKSANCGQQMASHRSGPVVNVTTHAAPCANPAFCAITANAVLSLNPRICVSTRESHIVSVGLSTFVPADPQPPLPPPPQA